jgi:hypothetical protein
VLPNFKAIDAHAHTCPLCAFQVLQITTVNDKAMHVCPCAPLCS